jgi:hypothetical protein
VVKPLLKGIFAVALTVPEILVRSIVALPSA